MSRAEITYSQRVKEEIVQTGSESRIEAFMEMSAMVQFGGELIIRKQENLIRLSSEQEIVITRVARLLGMISSLESKTDFMRLENASGKTIYFTILPAEISNLLEDLAGIDFFGNAVQDQDRILGRLSTEANALAFIRGAFLAGGSVVDPDKSYHLEIVANRQNNAELLIFAFKSLDIVAKLTRRQEQFVVYIKDSEEISNSLIAMGATGAMLELEDIKIKRDLSNQINRRANAETANLDKQYKASLDQIRAIKRIERGPGLASLPLALQEIARARLAGPMLNLRQLGQTLKPALGKSGTGHRIKRIMDIAANLEEEDEEGK